MSDFLNSIAGMFDSGSGKTYFEPSKYIDFFTSLEDAIFCMVRYGYQVVFDGPVHGNNEWIWCRIVTGVGEVRAEALVKRQDALAFIDENMREFIPEMWEWYAGDPDQEDEETTWPEPLAYYDSGQPSGQLYPTDPATLIGRADYVEYDDDAEWEEYDE